MERQQIEQVVLDAIRDANRGRGEDEQLPVSPEAAIFGPGSPLDSLGLVGLLIDIEERLREEGVNVTLSDERAVSQTRSPFRNVPRLVAYIVSLLEQPA